MAKKHIPVPPKSEPVRRRRVTLATGENSLTHQRNEKRKRDKERFLTVLEQHMGIISYAAIDAKINRRTVYEWMDQDPEFARLARDINEKQIDFVERQLLENIKNGCARAQCFYLGTKGRGRGYGPRVEVTTPHGEPFTTANTHAMINVDQAREEMSDKAMAKAIKAALKFSPEVFGDAGKDAFTGRRA